MTTRATVRRRAADDMHWADIKAALEKRGLTLARLADAHGYSEGGFSVVKRRSWPQVEQIIADALGERPETIWPSRYR